ncbi:MAG: biopolymer transporter ExbD [bacterium]
MDEDFLTVSKEYGSAEINISPLMDMVFILLIFFVVTASFVRETGVDVNKPKAQSAVSLDKESIMIGITREGTIHIQERQVSMLMLRAILSRMVKEYPNRGVVIIADRGSETGIAVDVMDECNVAGVAKISIAAMKE